MSSSIEEAYSTIVKAGDSGLLTKDERTVLLQRDCDGMTFQKIAESLSFSKQRALQLYQRGRDILRLGERPRRGRPKNEPMEYVLKLTPRQADSLKDDSLQTWIIKAERESSPYWTHVLSEIVGQIAEQNNVNHNQEKLWD